MFTATQSMGDLLKTSITTGKTGGWRTCQNNFWPTETPGLSARCINIAPCWFQQGREVGHYFWSPECAIDTLTVLWPTSQKSRRWV